jgi:uncharacterized membrane protein
LVAYVQVAGQFVGSAIAGGIFTACTFVELLILDRQMPVADAFRTSFQAARPKLLPIMGMLVLTNFLSGIGLCVCGIGLLFTLPMYYIFRAVLYHDFFRRSEQQPPAPPVDFATAPPPNM